MKKIKSIHLILIVLLAGLSMSLFNYGKPNSVSNKDGDYLTQAISISESLPTNFQRGPVYPYILALSFKLGKDKFVTAHWITQLIYLFALLLTFVFVNRLYGKWTAFISAISILFSIKLFFISWKFGVAFLVPVFLLSSYILYLQSVQEKQKWKFILSGITIGLALLSKESALFFILFPISLMLLLADFRTRYAIKGFFLYLSGILMILSPWLIYVYFNDQQISIILGELQLSKLYGYFGTTSLLKYLSNIIFIGGVDSIRNFFIELPTFPIMMLGIIIIFWKGIINKSKSDIIFIALFLPNIPLLMAYGLYLDGYRHIILPIIFFHIALANLFCLKIKYKKIINNKYVFYSLIILLLFFTNLGRMKYYIEKYGTGLPKKIIESRVTGKFSLRVIPEGRFGTSTIEVGEWINSNIKQGSILGTGIIKDGIRFYTNNKYKYIVNIPNGIDLNHLINKEEIFNDKIVQITVTKKFENQFDTFGYRQIFVLSYPDLVDYLNIITKQKMWIIIHKNDKIIFPLALTLIYDMTKKVYSNTDIIILETLPGKYDFSSRISKIINKDFDYLAKGNELHLNWLDTKRALAMLAYNKPDEYQIYYNYLLSVGINLTKLIEE